MFFLIVDWFLSNGVKLILDVKKIVKNDKVICALSGGVDSSVAALLINKAIRKNLICIIQIFYKLTAYMLSTD